MACRTGTHAAFCAEHGGRLAISGFVTRSDNQECLDRKAGLMPTMRVIHETAALCANHHPTRTDAGSRRARE